jgi:hypothetical protein
MDADAGVFDGDCVPAPVVNDFPAGFERNPSPGLRGTGITTPGNPDTIDDDKHVCRTSTQNFHINHERSPAKTQERGLSHLQCSLPTTVASEFCELEQMRKTSLDRLLAQRPEGIFVSPFARGEIGPDLYRAACKMGLEDIVSKRRDRPHQGGRSKHWVKINNRQHPAMERVMDMRTTSL